MSIDALVNSSICLTFSNIIADRVIFQCGYGKLQRFIEHLKFHYPGNHALLPPKSPFPSVSLAYVDYFIPTPLNGSKAVQKQRDVHRRHH